MIHGGYVATKTPMAPEGQKGETQIGGPRGIKPGRKKGAKNKSTLLREALNNDFEEQLQKDFSKVVGVVIKQAKSGCRQSQKLLLDRVIPTIHAESDKDKGSPFSGGVQIFIGSLENKQADVEQSIDAEYTINDEE